MKKGPAIILTVFLTFLLIVGAMYFTGNLSNIKISGTSLAVASTRANITTGAGTITGTSGISGTQPIVTTNPTIDFVGQQAQNIGNTFSTNYQVSVSGGAYGSNTASGTGTAVPGQVDSFLINASGYHNAQLLGLQIAANTFPLSIQMNKNASVTQVWNYPYANVNLYNAAAGGNVSTNITNSGSNGASYIINENMYGTSQASTQDMLCLVELTAGINATVSNPTGVQLTGNGVTPDSVYYNTAPVWYTPASTNSRVWGFDVPAISSSSDFPMTLTLQSQSSKSFPSGSQVIQTCYTKEYFIDSGTGKIVYGIADSQTNAIQSAAQYKFAAYFGPN